MVSLTYLHTHVPRDQPAAGVASNAVPVDNALMPRPCFALTLVLGAAQACATAGGGGADAGASALIAATTIRAEHIGQSVKLRGVAMNRKGGAVLVVGEEHVWIDGLPAWPEGYYRGGDRGRRLTVTGILHQDRGLPVSVYKKGDPIVQAVMYPEGTDLEKASQRFVLRDAEW